MGINFSKESWNKVIADSEAWWNDELDRPIIQIRLRKNVKTDFQPFQSFYPLEVPAEKIVSDCEQNINSYEYLGDGFPHFWPNFGAGVAAAFLGANLKNMDNTVWFNPVNEKDIKDISFQYDENNIWLNRMKDIVSTASKRWNGMVQIGMTDLGGNLDILSSFRPGEKLLLDLYDHPDTVENLVWQIYELWWQYFEDLENIIRNNNPGYSSWAMIFSKEPHYMLQSDFCYMISPEMFEKFVKPELKASSDKLTNAFYHLDGPGQLTHLDSLLEIESLKGIQWIPGSGSDDITNWPEVYRKISKAGKKIQLMSHLSNKSFDETLDIITDQTGRADNIVYNIIADISQIDKAEKLIERYCS